MRFYVSGPMRGIEDKNYPAFRECSALLRQAGHDVLDPTMSFINETRTRPEYLRHDVQLLMCVDALVVIDGWEDSPGARFEVATAWAFGIPCYYFHKTKLYGQQHELRPLEAKVISIPSEDQYLKGLPLIGLSGFAQAGKDEVAKILVSQGWQRVAFADTLKAVARGCGWDGSKDENGRKFLQDLGLAVRENLSETAWVDRSEVEIDKAGTSVVVTDCRFVNEVKMIRRRGGVIIRVRRPGVAAANGHTSEHTLTDLDADYVLDNDGTLEELPEKVMKCLENLNIPSVAVTAN